jgi:hypothetical protein
MSFPDSIISKFIVRDIIMDPGYYASLDNDSLDALFKSTGTTPGFFSDVIDPSSFKKKLLMAPGNSIIATIATPSNSTTKSSPCILYPFFSSHLSLPIKPGEAVWVIQSGLFGEFSPGASSGDMLELEEDADIKSAVGSESFCDGFWMSRVASPVYIEDPNFTHPDRARSIGYAKQQKSTSLPAPDFPDGIFNSAESGNDGEGVTDSQTLKRSFNYNRINVDARGSRSTTREAVPNFSKRPGDLTLQGSNNTLITLGEDRPVLEGKSASTDYAKPGDAGPRKSEKAGTIDIVAGRSLSLVDGNLQFDENQITTVINTRQEEETERRTWAKTQNGPAVKAPEGDPRYREDLSRVYVSMKTDGDSNFGFADSSSLPNPGQSLNPVAGKPYVVIKSNEARIITRNDGSVRIIKEGDRSGDHSVNQAVITMQPDGTIMIDGPKIIVGSGNAKGNGQGDQVLIGGTSASEPIVLGNALKGIIGELITAITTMQVPTGVGPSGPPINSPQFETIRGKLDTILSQVGKTK